MWVTELSLILPISPCLAKSSPTFNSWVKTFWKLATTRLDLFRCASRTIPKQWLIILLLSEITYLTECLCYLFAPFLLPFYVSWVPLAWRSFLAAVCFWPSAPQSWPASACSYRVARSSCLWRTGQLMSQCRLNQMMPFVFCCRIS